MKDPILKALIKYNRSFERLSDGTLIVGPMKPEPCQLTLSGESLKDWSPTPEQTEVASWFNRKPQTEWSKREKSVWLPLQTLFDFTSDDWNALKWYYTQSGCPYLRKDIGTLLNNWTGEIDRAKNYEPTKAK